MTALQCPARLFVAGPGGAPALVAALRAERVARVWCAASPAAVATAEAVAAQLGVGVVVRAELGGVRLGGRLPAVLGEIADEHRGEAVLVISDDRTDPDGDPGTDTGTDTGTGAGCVELEVDADGWRRVHRPPAGPPA